MYISRTEARLLNLPGFLKFIGDVTGVDQMPDEVTETAVLFFRYLKRMIVYVRGVTTDNINGPYFV